MPSVKSIIEEAKCDDLRVIIKTTDSKHLCYTRVERDTFVMVVTNGDDLWLLKLDFSELDTCRQLSTLDMDTYLSNIRNSFLAEDITLSQRELKLILHVGHGAGVLNFELYAANPIDKKLEFKEDLFRFAENSLALEKKLENAMSTIETLKQQKTAMGVASNVFGFDSKKKKSPVKMQPVKVGMSAINPGSKRRKAPTGVDFG